MTAPAAPMRKSMMLATSRRSGSAGEMPVGRRMTARPHRCEETNASTHADMSTRATARVWYRRVESRPIIPDRGRRRAPGRSGAETSVMCRVFGLEAGGPRGAGSRHTKANRP